MNRFWLTHEQCTNFVASVYLLRDLLLFMPKFTTEFQMIAIGAKSLGILFGRWLQLILVTLFDIYLS